MSSRRRDRNRREVTGLPMWNPMLLTGRTAWFRADQGVTLNSTTVSAWAAIDNPSITFTQGTAAKQPLFVASGGGNFGGQAHIQFDGAAAAGNDSLVGPAWSTFTTSTNGSVFMVISIDTGAIAGTDYCWGFLVGSGLIAMRVAVSAGNFSMNEQMSNNVGYSAGNLTYVADSPMSAIWNHNGTTLTGWRGNTSTSITTMAVATEHANAAAALLTVGHLTGSTAAPPMRVAEMLFGNQTATAADITGWNTYVQTRYAIAV